MCTKYEVFILTPVARKGVYKGRRQRRRTTEKGSLVICQMSQKSFTHSFSPAI